MKRTLALILVLTLALSLCGCGAGTQEDSAQTLVPATDFPEYTENFQLVIENVDVDENRLEQFMGYAKAAYDTYDAEQFCKYAYKELDLDAIGAISDAMSSKIDSLNKEATPEAMKLSLSLQNVRMKLLIITQGLASWKVDYLKIDASQNPDAYDTAMESLAFLLDQFAELVYGSSLLAP